MSRRRFRQYRTRKKGERIPRDLEHLTIAECVDQRASLEPKIKKLAKNVKASERILAEVAELKGQIHSLSRNQGNKKNILGIFYYGMKDEVAARIGELEIELKAKESKEYTYEGKLYGSIYALNGELATQLQRLEFERKRLEEVVLTRQRQKEKADRKERESALKQAYLNNAREAGSEVRAKLPRNHPCPYCFETLGDDPHADHIHPISKGGLSTSANMVFVCKPCNTKKRTKTLNAFIDAFDLDRKKVFAALAKLGKDY